MPLFAQAETDLLDRGRASHPLQTVYLVTQEVDCYEGREVIGVFKVRKQAEHVAQRLNATSTSDSESFDVEPFVLGELDECFQKRLRHAPVYADL